jgi:hypothetical protein
MQYGPLKGDIQMASKYTRDHGWILPVGSDCMNWKELFARGKRIE